MLCIGMGKHLGAVAYHTWAMKYGFFPLLKEMGGAIAANSNFRFGLAVVENSFDKALSISAVPAGRVFEDEARLNAPHIVDTVLSALRHNSAGVEEARA